MADGTRKLHLFASGDSGRTVLHWLREHCGIAENDLASVIVDDPRSLRDDPDYCRHVPRLLLDDCRRQIADDDLVIVAGSDIDRNVGELFSMGIHNVFDGNRLATRESKAARFLRQAYAFYIGPTEPMPTEPDADHPPWLFMEPVQAGRVPRHKLFTVNSLPKSGTVWMTAMLEAILGVRAREQITISHVADIEFDARKSNNHGSVALVRDLRDVVVSWFHHQTRIDQDLGFSEPRYPTVELFYAEHLRGLLCATRRYYFGNLERWLDLLAAQCVPIIRYEDLVQNTEAGLRKVLNFWKVSVDQSLPTEVAEAYAFSSMTDTVGDRDGYVADLVRTGHLRAGRTGTWHQHLPAWVASDIQTRFSAYQQRLGYL